MNKPCPKPGCSAVCTYSPEDIDREISCWRCGSLLKVTLKGLHLVHPAPAEPAGLRAEPPAPFMAHAPVKPREPMHPTTSGGFMSYLSTACFLLGMVVVIACLALPKIDDARINGFSARTREGDIPFDRKIREITHKYEDKRQELDEPAKKKQEQIDSLNDRILELQTRANDSAADETARQAAQTELTKVQKERTDAETERTKLEDEATRKKNIQDREERKEKDKLKRDRKKWDREKEVIMEEEKVEAEVHKDSWNYWYQWATMAGFVLLSVGALGYLSPRESTMRRVVGSIVLVAIVILIVQKFADARGLLFYLGGRD
jgi:hypothetical protein